MHLLRTIVLARSIVFLMVSMMMFHSIDAPDSLRTALKIGSSDNITFVAQTVFEHDAGDKEGRTGGQAEITLYRNQVPDLDLSSLSGVTVEFNSLNAINLFQSIAIDLPSPPPRG